MCILFGQNHQKYQNLITIIMIIVKSDQSTTAQPEKSRSISDTLIKDCGCKVMIFKIMIIDHPNIHGYRYVSYPRLQSVTADTFLVEEQKYFLRTWWNHVFGITTK